MLRSLTRLLTEAYTFYAYIICVRFMLMKKRAICNALKKSLYDWIYVIYHYYNFKTRRDMVNKIDFNNISDEIVYDIFNVDGNEEDALNDLYLELFELIGRDAMLKLYTHFRGDKIDCPMRLYRPEFIADLAKSIPDRRERAKIARAGGYSARVIESMLSKRRKENEEEQ